MTYRIVALKRPHSSLPTVARATVDVLGLRHRAFSSGRLRMTVERRAVDAVLGATPSPPWILTMAGGVGVGSEGPIFVALSPLMSRRFKCRSVVFGFGGRSLVGMWVVREHVGIFFRIVGVSDWSAATALSGLVEEHCVWNIPFVFPVPKLWYMWPLLSQQNFNFNQLIHKNYKIQIFGCNINLFCYKNKRFLIFLTTPT